MRKKILTALILFAALSTNAQTYENQFSKPLNQVLNDISTSFNVKLKCEADTAGKVVTFADFRIRP